MQNNSTTIIQQGNETIVPKEIKNLFAGGLAGMLAKTVVAPIDRIKILYQVTAIPFRLRDVPMVAKKIIKEEGVSALWKGNTVTMIRVFPYAGIQFMVFNSIKSYFVDRHEEEYWHSHPHPSDELVSISRKNTIEKDKIWGMSALESLAAGSCAGVISVLFTYPLDLTRAQLAVLKKQRGSRNGFVNVLMKNYNNGGAKGLFRGITPTLLGMLPYAGVAFSTNEQAKRHLTKVYDRDPTVVEKMLCGGVSGLFAQSMTYPFEVTRRRMQTTGVLLQTQDTAVNVLGGCVETKAARDAAKIAEEHIIHEAHLKSPSMFLVMKQVLKEQGVNGFFKGLTMNWLKGPVSFAISFTTFDVVKDWFEREEAQWRGNR
jgi:hypothetical protein